MAEGTVTAAPTSAAKPVTPAPVAPVADNKPGIPAKDAVKATAEAVKTGQPVAADDAWEVQIDGKPVKKSRKEILEAYQLRELSDKKRSEADKFLQEYNKLFKVAKEDPIKFMRAMGVDFDNLSTSYLAKKAEEAMMDPKELELQKMKRENDEYKRYQEEQKSSQEKAKQQEAISVERQKINQEIIQAIEEAKDLGLPVDEELVIAVAQKMILQDKKQKPLNAKEALPKAYESSQKFLKGIASKMDGEKLVQWLGDDVALKIRKYDLKRLKEKRGAGVPQPQSLVTPKKDETKIAPKYKTWSQFKSETLDNIK